MSEEKKAVVHDDELAAIKDSRKRELSVFKATSKESTVWIVAVSDHQAKLALVDRTWPMDKYTKRCCEVRYIDLLESAAEKGSSNGETQG